MPQRVRIVVLDGFTANPGDLSWEPLRALGECKIYERTSADLVTERICTADIVLTNKVQLDAQVMAAAEQLKLVCVLATGFDVVDIEAARQREIRVVNVPSYSSASVAQLVFAHLLDFTSHVAEHAAGVAAGRWAAAADWCYWDQPLVELSGTTMGIVGLGQIGTMVAKIADAFGMSVLATTRSRTGRNGKLRVGGANVELVELDELFRRSDVISLHCPLTKETHQLVDARRLALMQSTAYLINTARGGLIDSAALATALRERQIAGAGLDVLNSEPPATEHVLVGMPNCLITPHIAWATRAARQRLLSVAADNVQMFLQGRPQNVVNPW